MVAYVALHPRQQAGNLARTAPSQAISVHFRLPAALLPPLHLNVIWEELRHIHEFQRLDPGNQLRWDWRKHFSKGKQACVYRTSLRDDGFLRYGSELERIFWDMFIQVPYTVTRMYSFKRDFQAASAIVGACPLVLFMDWRIGDGSAGTVYSTYQ